MERDFERAAFVTFWSGRRCLTVLTRDLASTIFALPRADASERECCNNLDGAAFVSLLIFDPRFWAVLVFVFCLVGWRTLWTRSWIFSRLFVWACRRARCSFGAGSCGPPSCCFAGWLCCSCAHNSSTEPVSHSAAAHVHPSRRFASFRIGGLVDRVTADMPCGATLSIICLPQLGRLSAF